MLSKCEDWMANASDWISPIWDWMLTLRSEIEIHMHVRSGWMWSLNVGWDWMLNEMWMVVIECWMVVIEFHDIWDWMLRLGGDIEIHMHVGVKSKIQSNFLRCG